MHLDFSYKNGIFRSKLPIEIYDECVEFANYCRKYKEHKFRELLYLNNVGKNNYQCYIPYRLIDESFFLPYVNLLATRAFNNVFGSGEDFGIKIRVSPFNSPIYDVWLNYCDYGDSNEAHVHIDCDYSGVIYLQNDKEITFFENGEEILGQNGDIIFFHHDLSHWTNKQESIKERVTISFNLIKLK